MAIPSNALNLTAQGVTYFDGVSIFSGLDASTLGKVLTSNGTGIAPSFQVPATSGTVTTLSVVTANGFAGTVANASTTPAITLTTSQTGLLSGNGTAVTGTAITQYNVITAGASNAPNSVAPSATSGVPLISQGASSQPIFGTAVVAGGGTGNASTTAYALQAGGTTTTGAHQAIASVASGQVLVSAGTGALAAYSAYPQISGLGIGASPGSTAGITFDGTNFMNNYVNAGTFTPTLVGGSVAGTTTYSSQTGNYLRVGNLVFIWASMVISAATGTGAATFGAFPFTPRSAGVPFIGNFYITSAWAWPVASTQLLLDIQSGVNAAIVLSQGTATSGQLQMSNAAATFIYSVTFTV